MKNSSLLLLAALLLSVGQASLAQAEDINELYQKVQKFIEAENYPKALEELTWIEKEIEKKHLLKLESLIPADLVGYKGDKIKQQSALGFSTLERTYRNGNEQIKLSLTGGGNGTQGLASIGRMAAMMGGQQPGSETYRIEGRTVTLNHQEGSNRAELTIMLESGSILKLEQRKATGPETLKSAAETIKIVELDNYLKGASS